MISEWQVLGWLNRYDLTHLTDRHAQEILSLRSSVDPEKIFTNRINQLIGYARASSDRLERAEIILNCGLLCFSHHQFIDAEKFLEQAQRDYERVDLHRQAMAEMVLFIVTNSQEEHLRALMWARGARASLWKMVTYSEQQKDTVSTAWYKELINEITGELFQSPRYVFDSFFDLRGSRLSVPASRVKEKIEELLKDQNKISVYEKISKLLIMVQKSKSIEEKAEALAYCGMVSAEIGEIKNAIGYLRQSMVHYLPDTREYVLVRWMLGLIQYREPEYLSDVVYNMEECINSMARLAEIADHKNDMVPYRWFTFTGEAMRRIYRRQIANPA